jgi:hypothetical protein
METSLRRTNMQRVKKLPPTAQVATADILLPQTPAGIVKRPRGRGEVT